MNHKIPDPEEKPTLTIDELVSLGVFRTGRSATAEAVRRGDIPGIRVGRRWLIPTAELRRMLGLDEAPPATPLHLVEEPPTAA